MFIPIIYLQKNEDSDTIDDENVTIEEEETPTEDISGDGGQFGRKRSKYVKQDPGQAL